MTKILLLFIVLFVTEVGNAQDVAPDNEGMTQSAQEWTRDVVMGWNLGNALESSGGETNWGNPKTTQAMIKAVADA